MMLLRQNQLTIPKNQKAARLGDLELFKMLLQPHFLFNSLNNLYALSVKKSEHTAEAIAGLSDLLEKVVSISRKEFISLSQEVELIEDYINLEKIWLGETSFLLDFKKSGDMHEIILPPLLLYTFVENCYKHGIRKCASDGWLRIRIEAIKGVLYFSAKNQVPSWNKDIRNYRMHEGLGVIAARELLEKRCYGRYELKNGLHNNVYSVELKIDQQNKISA